MEYLKAVMPVIVTGIATVAAVIGALVWIAKRLVNSLTASQRMLTEGALDEMKANTKALNALTSGVEKFMTIHQERERSMFKQLDRIEAQQERRR